MGALSELPCTAEREQSVLFAEPAQPVSSEYFADEEFPPDLPVTYDWMFQPASQRSLRRALAFLAATAAAVLITAASYLAYRLPRLIVPFGAGLLAVIIVAVAIRKLSASLPARSKTPGATCIPRRST